MNESKIISLIPLMVAPPFYGWNIFPMWRKMIIFHLINLISAIIHLLSMQEPRLSSSSYLKKYTSLLICCNMIYLMHELNLPPEFHRVFCLFYCLFVCLFRFFVPHENFSLIYTKWSHHCRWMAANFDICPLSSECAVTCHTYCDTGPL